MGIPKASRPEDENDEKLFFCEKEVTDAVKELWKKEFGDLQVPLYGLPVDCYFICGFISEALEKLRQKK